jgi:hypothetical protein
MMWLQYGASMKTRPLSQFHIVCKHFFHKESRVRVWPVRPMFQSTTVSTNKNWKIDQSLIPPKSSVIECPESAGRPKLLKYLVSSQSHICIIMIWQHISNSIIKYLALSSAHDGISNARKLWRVIPRALYVQGDIILVFRASQQSQRAKEYCSNT